MNGATFGPERAVIASPVESAGQRAALEGLAAALDARDHITILTIGQGRQPHLTVASRRAGRAEDVYAQDDWFWWGWAERIAPTADVPAAASAVAASLIGPVVSSNG